MGEQPVAASAGIGLLFGFYFAYCSSVSGVSCALWSVRKHMGRTVGADDVQLVLQCLFHGNASAALLCAGVGDGIAVDHRGVTGDLSGVF